MNLTTPVNKWSWYWQNNTRVLLVFESEALDTGYQDVNEVCTTKILKQLKRKSRYWFILFVCNIH